MRLLLGLCLFLLAAGATSCAGKKCGRGDWCACSNGTDCFQSCDTDDGCRFFCFEMDECGATCGNECNFDFHDANQASASCGDDCHILCHENTSCAAICGAHCDYTSYNTQVSSVRAGANSTLNCVGVQSCVVECLGPCRVYCVDDVGECAVTCPEGAAPASCPDGSQVCGSC